MPYTGLFFTLLVRAPANRLRAAERIERLAVAAALEILAAEPGRVTRVRELADHWRSGLTALGFDTGTSRTAIVPVHVATSSPACGSPEG